MLMKFSMRAVILLVMSGLLAGCGAKWFRDRSEDYVKEETIPTLKVPKDTHAESFSDDYQIPAK